MARIIIIDGNNLIHKDPELKSFLNVDFHKCRENLVDMLKQYLCLKEKYEIILVFDNRRSPGNTVELGRLKIVYVGTRYGDADTFIKEQVKKRDRFYIVVSSDKSVFNYCETMGAISIKSEDFLKQFNATLSGKNYKAPTARTRGSGTRKAKKRHAALRDL